MTDFNSLLGVSVGPIGTTTTGNVADPSGQFVDMLGTQPSPGLAIENAIDKNPDEEARKRRQSQATGYPVQAIEADPEAFNRQERLDAINSSLLNRPATQRFMSNPDNADVAHDDVEKLGQVEDTWLGAAGKWWDNFVAKNREESLRNAELFGGDAGAMLKSSEATGPGPRSMGAGVVKMAKAPWQFSRAFWEVADFMAGGKVDAFKRFAAEAETKSAQGEALAQAVEGDAEQNPLPSWAKSGFQSAGQSVVTMPVALYNSVLGLLGLASTQVGESYEEGREQGLSPFSALLYGLEQGAVEFITERNPITKLTDNIKANAPIIKFFKDQVLTELPGEVFATAWQNLNKWWAIEKNQGKTFGEYMAEQPDQAAQTIMSTLVTIGVTTTTGKMIASGDFYEDQSAKAAEDGGKIMDEAAKVMQSTALMQRDPQRLVDHSVSAMRDAGIDKVWVDALSWNKYFNATDETLDEKAREWGLDPAKVREEIMMGGDIELTPQQFTQQVLLSPDYENVKQMVRFHPEAMTLAEAEQYKAEGVAAQAEAASRDAKAGEGEATAAEIGKQISEMTPAQAEVAPALEMAQEQIGLKALFRDATDAGMTPAGYETYLAQLQKAADRSFDKQARKALREEAKRLGDEWKAEFEKTRQSVEESLRQQPVYMALDGLQGRQFDRASVVAAFPDRVEYDQQTGVNKFFSREEQLAELPRMSGKSIVAPKTAKDGINAQVYAELHGYEDARTMFEDILTAPPIKDAADKRANDIMLEKHKGLRDKRVAVQEALGSLHNDRWGAVLTLELNQLREAQKAGRMKPKLLKLAARAAMLKQQIKDITVEKYLAAERRHAKQAARLLRGGKKVKANRKAATQSKFQQVLNFYMAQQAYSARANINKMKKFMRQFTRSGRIEGLPHEHLTAIRTILADYKLGPRMSERKRGELQAEAFMSAVEIGGTYVEIPDAIQREDATKNYQDLTLEEFTVLYQTVANIYDAGIKTDKLLKADEKRSVQYKADAIVDAIRNNLKPRQPDIESNRPAERRLRNKMELSGVLFNADTFLRQIDGWADLGMAYETLKGPYDHAFTKGYQPGSRGYVTRQKENAQALLTIFKEYTPAERARMDKKLDIPGLDRQGNQRLSRAGVLSVLLNSGNGENIAALTEGGVDARGNSRPAQFTQEELQAVWDFADAKDFKVAQAVLDYIETLWPEIEQATIRRRGYAPERVEATPIETKHGTFRGGYFPLRYDRHQALVGEQDAKEMQDKMRYGAFIQSHTRDGHTKARVGSGGLPVLLDPFVINSHLDQVLFDLEMGDALADIYKVLYHKDVRNAFRDVGRMDIWKGLELWLGDVVTGELRAGGVEAYFRWIRTGFTVSKLGLNLGVVALQPLGLLQSAVQIGKRNLASGVFAVLAHPVDSFRLASELSVLMQQREDSYNKDIIDASRALRESFLAKLPGGKKATEIAHASLFYALKKTQYMVDVMTWMGARKAGMEKFQNDEALANEYADRMVTRAQGSGNFGERSAVERGTINNKIRQTELVRVWTTLMSYYIAKANVAYERTGKTDFKNPGQIANWAADMMLLYTVEAMIGGLIYGGWPDDDESLFEYALSSTWSSFSAQFPIVRDIESYRKGFDTAAGSIGATVKATWDAAQQVGQAIGEGASALWYGEEYTAEQIDSALLRKSNSLLGILLHYPASQINKTGAAIANSDEIIARMEEGEWSAALDFLFGPSFDK